MPRPRIETNDVDLPDAKTIDLSSNIDKPDLAVVMDEDLQSENLKYYNRELAFFEEKVTFTVAPSADPTAPKFVDAGNNGEVHRLHFGKQYTLARKFLDSILNITHTITTQTYQDENNLEQTRMIKTPMPTYSVSIHHDPSGDMGMRWFLHKLQHG